MPDLVTIRRALISVSDKRDLVPFARGLADLGVTLISTGGTAAVLAEAGLDVIAVDEVTGFPEMMDGRVKTLHPVIHGGLLARRDHPEHVAAMKKHGIEPIDLVCINLYPFEQTIRREGVSDEDAIEQIDIGGPSMLRSAAKNHDFVTVVTDPNQYDGVINEIRANDGATTGDLRRQLAAAAFMRTAEYDTTISAWMGRLIGRAATGFPEMLQLSYARAGNLRYGENPHQKAAVYSDPASMEASLVNAPLLHGKPLSYNNILDGSAAMLLVRDLAELFPGRAASAIIKHTNPCGAAVAETLTVSLDRAHSGDPLAAFGGVLAVSTAIDATAAERITAEGMFLEVIVAPAYTPDAIAMLSRRWANVRLLEVPAMSTSGGRRVLDLRSVPGGLLVQEADDRLTSVNRWSHVAGPAPDEALLDDAAFAWTVVKHLKSNAIVIGLDQSILGAGPGQVDRVQSCDVAIGKAGDRLAARAGAGGRPVAASDAFFPFPDGPQALIDAGVRCIVQPGGSRRDDETVRLCNEREVTLMMTGVRHFRH